jgi:hypothetical protein
MLDFQVLGRVEGDGQIGKCVSTAGMMRIRWTGQKALLRNTWLASL